MASSHYEVAVKEVNGKNIQLTLRAVHPDNLVFPASKTFAFMLLCDPFWDWDDDIRLYGRGMPLFEEMNAFNLLDSQYVRANAGGFIESVELKATRNYPMTEEKFVEIVEGDEPHHLPEGDYSITTTHFGWALHLTAGMRWDSASYDLGDGQVWEGEKRIPGDMTWVRAINQDEGFVLGERDEYNAHILGNFLVPKFGPKHYEPDPAFTEQDITADALQALLYRPVALRVRGDYWELYVGILSEISENEITIYHQTSSSRGIQGLPIKLLVYIGSAHYRKQIRVI